MDFDLILPYAVVASITGAAIVTGLLFAFSNFVMSALAELDSEHAMYAMQQINEKIINPLFLFVFLGTPIICIFLIIYSLLNLADAQSVFLLLGALGYIIGPFGVTVRCNVPLNDKLATVAAREGEEVWKDYQIKWQRWNHIRTYIGLISIVILCLGLWITPSP
jgi:uncharacterized membrane protein